MLIQCSTCFGRYYDIHRVIISLLLPYEQYYIQSLHQAGRLIPEQSPGETNPLFQTAINPQPPHPT